MSEQKQSENSDKEKGIDQKLRWIEIIEYQERKKIRSRQRSSPNYWYALGMAGMIGWSVIVPIVLGLLLGFLLDAILTVDISFVLIFLIVGAILGCLNGWYWLFREQKEIEKDRGT